MGFSQEHLELVVLSFKLSKLCSVGRLHAAKAGAPLIEGWLAKATGPAKFLDGHARVSLFEEANDLRIGKSGLFHSRYSPKLADFVPSLWYGRQGAGHLTDIFAFSTLINVYIQNFSGVAIHCEHSKLASIKQIISNKVHAPDLIDVHCQLLRLSHLCRLIALWTLLPQ
jgi:hypothetical protein